MPSPSSSSKSKLTSNDSKPVKSVLRISNELQKFYAEHNVDLSSLISGKADPFPYRYVRLNPRYNRTETLKMLKEELGWSEDPLPVTWIDTSWGFYALPSSFSLATSRCFKSGRIYGMDVSSGAGPAVLLSNNYDMNKPKKDDLDEDSSSEVRVLDLCCCPGLKLCALADFLRERNATIIGVDVSESRMALCKKIISKYHVDSETSGAMQPPGGMKVQLYCQDGTSFGVKSDSNNLVFDSRSTFEEAVIRGKRRRMNKSARARERKRLKMLQSADWAPAGESQDNHQDKTPSIKLFDYVLVDAECSTDGSMKHMKERLKDIGSQREETNAMLMDKSQLADLVDLQKRLIESGYRLLKPGGTLVYSTCSLSHDQNENVVKWLLDKMPDAVTVPVHFPGASSKLVVEGSLQGTIRFYPNLGQESLALFGDGFFLAKLAKQNISSST